jgi:hypothetical protein
MWHTNVRSREQTASNTKDPAVDTASKDSPAIQQEHHKQSNKSTTSRAASSWHNMQLFDAYATSKQTVWAAVLNYWQHCQQLRAHVLHLNHTDTT